MFDDQERIDQGVCLAVIVIVVLLAICAESRGDDLHDRAAAAIAIHNAVESNPWLPPASKPETPPVPPPKTDATRPVVVMYSASWCGPCQSAKATLKQSDLPFDLKIVDVSNGGQPGWCASLPAFGWQANGKTRYVLGFPGAATLIWQWKATQASQGKATAKQATWLTTDQLRAFAKTYNGPLRDIQGKRDDYRSHLLDLPNHGFQYWQVQNLSQWECERIHGAQHAGYITPTQIVK